MATTLFHDLANKLESLVAELRDAADQLGVGNDVTVPDAPEAPAEAEAEPEE